MVNAVMDEKQLLELADFWQGTSGQYILISGGPYFPEWSASILDTTTGRLVLLDCDNDVYFEVLRRMRNAGVKEYTSIPEEFMHLESHPMEIPPDLVDWLDSNRKARQKKT